MPDFLAEMASGSRARALAARAAVPEGALRSRIATLPAPTPLRLSPAGFDVIAEVKPSGPRSGRIVPLRRDPEGTARFQAALFAHAGPCALSVLTEPSAFGGTLASLAGVAASVALPVMRKDFLVEPYQVVEARAHGASGVLLIVRLVDGRTLRAMLDVAFELGLFALLEAFDRADLDRAGEALLGSAGAGLIGVNARDLATLGMEPDRFERLAAHAPRGIPRVAESGLSTPDDAARVAALGYQAALVGEAAMRAVDPVGLLASMIDAGRAAVRSQEVPR